MRNNRIARILALLLALLMCFTSCAPLLPPAECTHRDIIPKDNICDFCGEEMPTLPGDDTPGDDTPGDDTPGDDTPGTDTPGTDTPGTDTPGTDTPGTDTPGTDTPGGDTPGGTTGGGSIPDESYVFVVPSTSGQEFEDGKLKYIILNGNVPRFTSAEYITVSFEHYGALDSLGRCTGAYACIGLDIMPGENETRGDISSITPTGWFQASYATSLVPGGYIWNRSHLIAWMLTAENANECNLITGTPYFNQTVMKSFEDQVQDYIKETGNHVLYRVTPVFEGTNKVASGVVMEAWSVEDNGEGICFNVYVKNVQDGIYIDYSNGHTCIEGEQDVYDPYIEENPDGVVYVINLKNNKIHLSTCRYANSASNTETTTESLKALATRFGEGNYSYCGTCKPQNNPNKLKTTAYTLFIPYIEREKRVA